MQQEQQEPARPGLFDSARRLLAGLAELAHTRLDLLSTELQEELARLGLILLVAIVALSFTILGILLLAIALLVAVDESHRLTVALLLGLGFLFLGALGGWWMRKITRSKPRIFDASLTELRKDRDWLDPR